MTGVRAGEILRYLRFSDEDRSSLIAFAPAAPAAFGPMVDDFYARVLEDEEARRVLSTPELVEGLKGSLRNWAERILKGPWDEEYFAVSSRIGRRHVQVGLPLRYMPLAMNVMRQHLMGAVLRSTADPNVRERTLTALHRVLDLELTWMLEVYQESFLDQMLRAERLATLAQLAAAVSHELKNPLGVINTSLHLLRRLLEGQQAEAGIAPAIREHVDRMARSSRQASELATHLLEFTRSKLPRRQVFSARELIDEALDVAGELKAARVDVAIEPADLEVEADANDLARVLANLLKNADQALAEADRAGTIHLRARRLAGAFVLEIADDGPGIRPDALPRIFDPLFTTRSRGTGLGLPIARELVQAHGGDIEVDSAPGKGACFTVRIPQKP